SLACVLYECLAGARPFERESELSVVFAHLIEPPPPITDLRAELPASLNDVFANALAKSPDDRYPTCRELVEAARAALLGESRQPPRRRPRVLLVAVTLAAGAAGLGFLLSSGNGSSTRPTTTPAVVSVEPNSITLVSARTQRVIDSTSLPSAPSDVVFG